MKKNYFILISLMALFILMLTAFPAMARPPGPPMMNQEEMQARMEARDDRMRILLDLTEEQQALLQQHRTTHRQQAQTFGESMQVLREKIRVELQNPALDISALDQLRTELKELSAKMADHRIQGILEVREILTPEQFAKFQAMRPGPGGGQGRHHGRGGMMGQGMGMQPPPDMTPEQ